jgi:hypothetical protein
MWEDDIKIDLREVEWDSNDVIDLTQDQRRALANKVMNLLGP